MINVDGAWQEEPAFRINIDEAWQDAPSARVYDDGAWQEILTPEPLYLIKDGVYQVDFTEVPYWKNSSGNGAVTENASAGYVQIATDGMDMPAIITTDAINLTRYKTLNIDATAQIYLYDKTLYNHAAAGVYESVPSSIMTGTSAALREGNLLHKQFYSFTGSKTTSFKDADGAVDISSVNQEGHIYIGISSWNYSDDYSKLRIMNLWLS